MEKRLDSAKCSFIVSDASVPEQGAKIISLPLVNNYV